MTLIEKIKSYIFSLDLFTKKEMDEAKTLTHFALTHQAISKEDKEEFTYWLQSLQTNQAETARLRGGQSQQGQVSNMTPQVTISGVTGNIVQYDMMSSPTMENRTPRPWRSNSLTPPSNVSSNLSPASPSTASEWFGVSKGRSHSLTFDRDQAGLSEATKNISPASSTTALDEKEIEEMIKLLPEGSGMREIREWLKSLRLHKYTKMLLEISYEELLQLSDETLEMKNVTMGARGKILKYISHIRDRPNTLKQCARDLTVISRSNDSDGLVKVLRELEAIVLMPLKPYRPSLEKSFHRSSMISNRTDSGFESDTSCCSGDTDENDIPGQTFDALKTISTEIFVKEYTNHEVVTVFACLLEKCSKREAYTASQKQLMSGWLQKLKTLWNPPHIKKATDYKKRPFRSDSSCGSMRRPSYVSHRINNQVQVAATSSSVLFNKNCNGMTLMPSQPEKDEPQTGAVCYTQRRSMPEIKPHQIHSQIKRNSYQGEESQMNMDAFNPHSAGQYIGNYRNSFSGGCGIRRESSDSGYLMSLPESRRDSEVDGFNALGYRSGVPADLRRDSEDFFQQQLKMRYGKPYNSLRRDSGTSDDFLTVESAIMRSNGNGGTGGIGIGGVRANVGVIGGLLKNPGSMSSGCASDGSTDSLLEQDLHNLSLAVTQQALE